MPLTRVPLINQIAYVNAVDRSGPPPRWALSFHVWVFDDAGDLVAIEPFTNEQVAVLPLFATSADVLDGTTPSTQSNAWPYDGPSFAAAISTFGATPATWTMPAVPWAFLRHAASLTYMFGTMIDRPAPLGPAVLWNHARLTIALVGPAGVHADAGAGRILPMRPDRTMVRSMILEGSASIVPPGASPQWSVLQEPAPGVTGASAGALAALDAVVFPAGSPAPVNAAGKYKFRLTLAGGSGPALTADVQHEVVPTGVRVSRPDGSPAANIPGVLIPPGSGAAMPITTGANGHINIPLTPAGSWQMILPGWDLMPPGQPVPGPPVRVATVTDIGANAPGGTPVSVGQDEAVAVVAHQIVLLECAGCGRTFVTTGASPTSGVGCPQDLTDLAAARTKVLSDDNAARNPPHNQNVFGAAPLVSRGAADVHTKYRVLPCYWDETRFVAINGGDYRLWGDGPSGPLFVPVVGRASWKALPPLFGPQRTGWGFHDSTTSGRLPEPYRTTPVPNSENKRLGEVFKWMTVHHTADLGQASTMLGLQHKHQFGLGSFVADQGSRGVLGWGRAIAGWIGAHVPGGPLRKELRADVGYHFVIDPGGVIFEGRPVGIEGSHCQAFNAANIGIVLMGDFDRGDRSPTSAQLLALDRLVEVLAERFNVRSVWSHQRRKEQVGQGATDCPGKNLLPHVDETLRRIYPGPPE